LIAVLFLPSTSETTISPVLEFTTPTFSFSGPPANPPASPGDDELLGREVRRGEIDHLFAFIGDGDPGDDDVAVAGVQRGEDAFPWGIIDGVSLRL
jgi:hypothetical protein